MSDTITLDEAQQRLGDAGYEVTAYLSWGTVVANLDHGDRGAHVCLFENEYYHVAEQRPGDDRPMVVDEWWPDTVGDAVDLAVALAGKIAQAQAVEQEHAVIGDELADEAAEVDQAPVAEAAQDGAAPAGCARCGGTPLYKSHRFCAVCVDRCHEATDFAHECAVCAHGGADAMTDGAEPAESAVTA